MLRALPIAALVLACCASPAPPPSAPAQGFDAFVDAYFAAAFDFEPTNAVSQGFHDYDGKLEDCSRASFERRIATLQAERAQLAPLATGPLTPVQRIDAVMIGNAIDAELLQLQDRESWRHNPMRYVGLPGSAIDTLMKRDFAPARQRLESVIVRLGKVPAILEAMKANLDNPPKEFTDLSIRMAKGSVGFFQQSAVIWAKEAAGGDAKALERFTAANALAARAMEDAAKWLESDLLPRSKGSFAVGAASFTRQLQLEEMVDLPLDRLLAIGEANLKKDAAAFLAVAKQLDPTKTPSQAMEALSNQHPTAASLLDDTRKTIEGSRQFLVDHHIVTVPSEVRPRIEETPPYARSGSFASMDTPGAFEEKATEAFYYVTPPEKDWDPKHVEEHLRLYNPPVMNMITVHEAFPGHFLQFIYGKQYPTRTRKLLGASSNSEGWAHYSEQMMVDEGFGGGDPKLRLAQLSEALLRDCRFVVGIKLHTEGWSVDQGAKLFHDACYQESANAFEEARRGAYNPTYLYYTLGKLQILKLREDYRKAKGADYSLQAFHDAFVKEGALPLKLLRPILLPGDTGETL